MSELPSWVRKRDGRVVPFDPDAISEDLFAAAEALGQADPFLARELTDGVLHFLAHDCPDPIPTTDWIADLVAKVVRELRQPRLAQAFAEFAQRPRPTAVEPPSPAALARKSASSPVGTWRLTRVLAPPCGGIRSCMNRSPNNSPLALGGEGRKTQIW